MYETLPAWLCLVLSELEELLRGTMMSRPAATETSRAFVLSTIGYSGCARVGADGLLTITVEPDDDALEVSLSSGGHGARVWAVCREYEKVWHSARGRGHYSGPSLKSRGVLCGLIRAQLAIEPVWFDHKINGAVALWEDLVGEAGPLVVSDALDGRDLRRKRIRRKNWASPPRTLQDALMARDHWAVVGTSVSSRGARLR